MYYPVIVLNYSCLAPVKPRLELVLGLSCIDPGSATHAFAQHPILIYQPHPESALVLTCNALNYAPLALSLLVSFGFPY